MTERPFDWEWQQLVDARNQLREARKGHPRAMEMLIACADKLRAVAQSIDQQAGAAHFRTEHGAWCDNHGGHASFKVHLCKSCGHEIESHDPVAGICRALPDHATMDGFGDHRCDCTARTHDISHDHDGEIT